MVAAYRLLIQRHPCFVPLLNSQAEIIWKIFVDIVQTNQLPKQLSATAPSLTMCLCVTSLDVAYSTHRNLFTLSST